MVGETGAEVRRLVVVEGVESELEDARRDCQIVGSHVHATASSSERVGQGVQIVQQVAGHDDVYLVLNVAGLAGRVAAQEVLDLMQQHDPPLGVIQVLVEPYRAAIGAATEGIRQRGVDHIDAEGKMHAVMVA